MLNRLAVLLGRRELAAQDSALVLEHFGRTLGKARQAYRLFVLEGVASKKIPDLEGGGLRRSAAGWELVPKLSSGRERWASDERILGSTDFVREVLAKRFSPKRTPSCSSGGDGDVGGT